VIAEYGSSGSWLRRFYYGPGIDEPVCLHINNGGVKKLYYYHYDGLGSVAALSDVNGTIVERYDYDVYGEPTIRDANDQILTASAYDNPYMFTGRRYDPETALYYYRARYYAPDIGRFLQTNPVGYVAGLNLYTYCWNNLLNWIDPWGLNAWGWGPYGMGGFGGSGGGKKGSGEGDGVSLAERLAADLYESGHALMGATWAVQYGLTSAIGWSLTPLSGLSDAPDIAVPATRYNPPFIIPASKIGTVASTADLYLGGWLEGQAAEAWEQMEWHWSQEWQWGQME